MALEIRQLLPDTRVDVLYVLYRLDIDMLSMAETMILRP